MFNVGVLMIDNILVINQEFLADSPDSISLSRGDLVEILKTTEGDAFSREKLRDFKPELNSRWYVRLFGSTENGKEGWIPTNILDFSNDSVSVFGNKGDDANFRMLATVRELIETEEEFSRDLQNIVDRYIKAVDKIAAPRIVRDSKDIIFSNFEQIAEFHNMILIEGLKYYSEQPNLIAKTFLRLERDFDKHLKYCAAEPLAQAFLQENKEANEYFQQISKAIGDDKNLCEHLKLPIQRINDYQFLLKELIKYSHNVPENTKDLQKALELMLSVPNRAFHNKLLSSIEGYRGNIYKIGRLLNHDWWTIKDSAQKSHDRYLFLFKSRILISNLRKINEERSIFVLQNIIKLPDCNIENNVAENVLYITGKPGKQNTCLPITLKPHKIDIRERWFQEIVSYIDDESALQEHFADDLRIDSSQVLHENELLLHLPQKAEAHNPYSGIKASDVAHDYYLTDEERKKYLEEQTILLSNRNKQQHEAVESKIFEENKHSLIKTEESRVKEKEKCLEDHTQLHPDRNIQHFESTITKENESSLTKSNELFEEERIDFSDMVTENALLSKKKDDSINNANDTMLIEKDVILNQQCRDASTDDIELINKCKDFSNIRMLSDGSVVSSTTRDYERGSSYDNYGDNLRSTASSRVERRKQDDHRSIFSSSRAESRNEEYYGSRIATRSSSRMMEENNLKSLEKPEILRPAKSAQVKPGESAHFEVQFVEKPGLVVWLKDNKPLEDKLADRVVQTEAAMNSYRLDIKNCSESDAGTYTAKAISGIENVTCSAQLAVGQGKSKIDKIFVFL
ncbi:obscurin-like isoform X3 [Bactrocera tryoni]|uniref:obscurin-like isoform X3 n=1 Tax=Bactrocera tryoni TaxID=59916 RepID=UPI001A95FD5A|nr:obscurin-like isoform X3 [Bactrocera tryoni]